MSSETDRRISMMLAFAPAILIVALVIILLLSYIFEYVAYSPDVDLTIEERLALLSLSETLSTASDILVLVTTLVSIYIVYLLVKRRDEHFKRAHLFYSSLIEFLRSRLGDQPELRQASLILDEMKMKERPRGPILWAILAGLLDWLIVPVIYLYHFLNKDFHQHEARERLLLETLAPIFQRLGVEPPRMTPQVPNRSTALYLVLSILTLGLFVIYWYYTLIKDPNMHFEEHARFESRLLAALEGLAAAAPYRP